MFTAAGTISADRFVLLCLSYRQNLPVSFIVSELAFESADAWYAFAEPFSLSYSNAEKTHVDCKTSMKVLAAI
jgi:hypothetical protein